ncbi:adhesion G protein-coupled receptor L4-like isoform X2 [Sycon ciliatum]
MDLGMLRFTAVTWVEAQYNRIANIATGGFPHLQSIVGLNLQYNQLSVLPSDISQSLSLKVAKPSINLDNNPWNCACSAAFLALRDLLNRLNSTTEPQCSQPANLTALTVKSFPIASDASTTNCGCQASCPAPLSLGCDPRSLTCICASNAQGGQCQQCTDGFYNASAGCLPCGCNVPVGSRSVVCDKVSGKCPCYRRYDGRDCMQCADFYHKEKSGFCTPCNCNPQQASGCEPATGACSCLPGYKGAMCNACADGFFTRLPPTFSDDRPGLECNACNCTQAGSSAVSCDRNGTCRCLAGTTGVRCDTCKPGYFKQSNLTSLRSAVFTSLSSFLGTTLLQQQCSGLLPDSNLCQECCCNPFSSHNSTCDGSGQCYCYPGYGGKTCSLCAQNYTAYTDTNGTYCVPDELISSYVACPRSFYPILGIYWPTTVAGLVSVANCPQGFSGNMTRNCSADGVWSEPNVDRCVSVGFFTVAELVNTLVDSGRNQTLNATAKSYLALSVLHRLSNATGAGSALFDYLVPGDIRVATDTLKQLTQQENVMNNDTREDFAQSYVRTVSNLLDSRNIDSWQAAESSQAPTLLESTSDFALYTAQASNLSLSVYVEPNIAMQVSVQRSADTRDVVFPDYSNPVLGRFSTNGQSQLSNIKVPAGAIKTLQERSGYDALPVASVIYNNLNEFYPLTVESQDGDGERKVLNTVIITTRIGVVGVDTSGLQEDPVTITLRHENSTLTKSPECVFWNFSQSAWDGDGLVRVSTEEQATVCQSNHLTSFAVLVSPTGGPTGAHDVTLSYITYIGCGISLACLVVMIVILFTLRKETLKTSSARHSQNIIHLNLAITLACAQITFIAGITSTENRVTCGVVAGLLQYFYTVAFAWMAVEGYHLYLMTERVFKSRENQLKIYIPVAWGIPLINVGISAGVRYEDYGTKDYCWLSIENGTIWAFLGPVCGIILFNTIVFFNTLRVLVGRVKDKGSLKAVKTGLRAMVLLLPLLGLTWVFGLFAVSEGTVAFAYLFTIFNSLQGACLFLLHVVLNKKVRESYGATVKKSTLFKMTSRSSISPEPRKISTQSVQSSQDLLSTTQKSTPSQSVHSMDASISENTEKPQLYLASETEELTNQT